MAKLSKRGAEAQALVSKWMRERFDGRRSTRADRLAYGRMVVAKCPRLTGADVVALDAHVAALAQ